MNFARDVVDTADPAGVDLIEWTRDGDRREWTFATAQDHVAKTASWLLERGVRRGDVVMTVIGNRPEWVAMAASFRIGAVALPCIEQVARERPAAPGGGGPARCRRRRSPERGGRLGRLGSSAPSNMSSIEARSVHRPSSSPRTAVV